MSGQRGPPPNQYRGGFPPQQQAPLQRQPGNQPLRMNNPGGPPPQHGQGGRLVGQGGGGGGGVGSGGGGQMRGGDVPDFIYQSVRDLTHEEKREQALQLLSKRREKIPALAPILWHSYGTIAALIQEIIVVYPYLSPPRLTPVISNRCCNALALLQCIASNPETRPLFLESQLGLFLFPFLNTTTSRKQYEYLRLTSLGVIGALVKVDDSKVINRLLQTSIIPLCLQIMDNGRELSKTVATFIIQKILLDANGLQYVCFTYERFSRVSTVLAKMVNGLDDFTHPPSMRLLHHIIRCYLRLTDNQRACVTLRKTLPQALRDPKLLDVLDGDHAAKWLRNLLFNLSQDPSVSGGGGHSGGAPGPSGGQRSDPPMGGSRFGAGGNMGGQGSRGGSGGGMRNVGPGGMRGGPQGGMGGVGQVPGGSGSRGGGMIPNRGQVPNQGMFNKGGFGGGGGQQGGGGSGVGGAPPGLQHRNR